MLILESDIHIRNISSIVDPIKTIVAGDGLVDIQINKSYNAMITVKDSFGNNISVWADMFYIRFSNECSITSQVAWSQVIEAAIVLALTLEALMTITKI